MGEAGGWDGEAVRARLGELARRDPEYTRFGSEDHRYRLTPPLPERALSTFEERYAIELPRSYREFLARVGGSGAGPHYGLLPLDEPLPDDSEDAVDDVREQDRRPGFLATPFPLCGEWRGNPGERFDDEAERARVAGSLVIAEAGCGEFVRLVVTGPLAGQVWYDDMTWDHLVPGPDFRVWYLSWLRK
ncbi:SMI1/KNR4 family protein [Streptomyces sp. NPDC058773]|uniref:SMI1/KNR4 family protein n=1 Tax=Streptomyces sp. NPDC058773 TaxID=3346632 RepID=UPI0036C39709